MEKLRTIAKKAQDYVLGMNFATSLVLCLVAKAVIADLSYAAFLVTVPVLAHDAFKQYLKSKTPDPVKLNAEVRQELEAIKTRMNALNMEKNVQPQAKRFF